MANRKQTNTVVRITSDNGSSRTIHCNARSPGAAIRMAVAADRRAARAKKAKARK